MLEQVSVTTVDNSLPKSHKLLCSSDFSCVFDAPSYKIHHSHFLILVRFNNLDHPRVGLVIAKKNIRLAHERNRTKRFIRETFRNKQHKLPAIDAIVLARRGIEKLSNKELSEILVNLWKRAAKKAAKVQQDAQ